MLTMSENIPIALTETDYLYLSDALEPISAEQVRTGAVARFVLQRKEDTLRRLVRCVLERELNEEERMVAKLLFMEGLGVSAVARRCGISRGRVYTLSAAAKEKLHACLQYPVLMDCSFVCPPRPFFEILQKYGGLQ